MGNEGSSVNHSKMIGTAVIIPAILGFKREEVKTAILGFRNPVSSLLGSTRGGDLISQVEKLYKWP